MADFQPLTPHPPTTIISTLSSPLIRIDALETLHSAEIGLFEFRSEDDRREYHSLSKPGTGTHVESDRVGSVLWNVHYHIWPSSTSRISREGILYNPDT